MTISAGDAGFHSTGCGTWNEVRSTYPGSPSSTFSDGAFVVSRHIVAGTYHASGLAGEACYWQRLSGFNGEFSDIIANDFDGSLVVTIAASDAGFSSVGCGRWTRL
ncbi:hypothetical protein OCAE111667_26990 [Occultella aeris]|uniref:Uncharacterized protein n=1 Tax=Occultella aeris TaxID=2761496 RepID=A0A7M4DL18_9MICO|nr:hypothetical protein HALOF300_02833 [Occultella aeris]